VHVELDRPRDALLTGRAELLAGWVAPAGDDFAPTASCGGRPVLLRPCFHPIMLQRPDARGFWGYVFVQEVVDEARQDRLRIELRSQGRHVGSLSLRLTPSARLLAAEYPLDLTSYHVPALPDAARRAPAPVVVFPGLGGVGGATLNEVMRVAMLRAGWDVPVHFEADHPALWSRVQASYAGRYRWIDGHGCHGAATMLGLPHARVTLLREPAKRLLSVFDYGALVHPDAYAHASFDDFLDSPDALRATQAVSLLRCAGVAAPEALPPDELLARASAELDEGYALVGATELFEESLLLLCQLAGLDSIGMWRRVLAAPRSVPLEELPARTRARLDALVEIDRRLHERALHGVRSRLAGAGLADALRIYKAAAARERPLPDVLKQLECLRWRQVLGEPSTATTDGAHVNA